MMRTKPSFLKQRRASRRLSDLLQRCLIASVLASAPVPAFAVQEAETHAASLLKQMSLDEKIGQMVQADVGALHNKADIQKYFLGSVLSGGDSDPPDNTPKSWLAMTKECESWALKTRLEIPLLYGVDAVHGHNNIEGAVIFPHNVGLGAMRDPALVEKAEHITALEVAATGIHWAFAPCIAVSQNIRWGRSYESFGESPELVSSMGAAAVKGIQSPLPNGAYVLATAKHFMGDGGTENGVDQGNTVCDEATFRKIHLAPYIEAVRAGAGSIMISYNSWNGQKMHGNKHLLTDVLKGELGFRGFLLSDWAAIDQLSPDYKNDIQTAIRAGLDMIMIPNGPGQKNSYVDFIRLLKELVGEGKVPQSRIDDAVQRILVVKFQMGLFDHPYAAPELMAEFGSAAHREVARQCVRESLVLLRNRKNALPLSKTIHRLAVVGAAANDLGTQCGGWTISWQGRTGTVTPGGTTILKALRQTTGKDTKVTFAPEAGKVAGADAVLVVIGEKPYAEMKGDRADLRLNKADAALIASAKAHAGAAPVIVLLLSGRPLVLGSALDTSDAFIAAWLPGTEGQGVADVLFGDYKPTGKLPRAWPRSNEQAATAGLRDPQFPFGFGLTY